ncbi:hypothetical protein D9758_003644 [Tetrapyrgos nigripes]|uniref:PHD-type domain-containing protein n=1 Tax=Tetrapyrgos nigripes TaxID=182062 RepID=A0A8H5GMV7_9AGAR|nr:hypothetical protein D9758_003644 [Tetrapyrgos nigripes]
MNTEDYDYDDVRRNAALGLLGLSPTNLHPPSTPLNLSGFPMDSGSLSSSTPNHLASNRSPSISSLTAPRRRTPIESQHTPSMSAGASSRSVSGSGRTAEEEAFGGQATSPIIPLKRKHLSNSNETSSSQLPNNASSSSQSQSRRRGAGGGRGSNGRGRGGRGSGANAGAGVRHTSDGQHSNSGPGSVSSTRFDPVAHARRTNDRDAASRDIDSLSITTHTATPDRDQEMPAAGGGSQHDRGVDHNADSDVDPESNESIRCICGVSNDDGWSIGCDGCGRWCHGICFGIDEKDKENLPERWECWVCDPTLVVDRERAVRLQKAKSLSGGTGKVNSNGDGDADVDRANSRRRTSPGVERKPRKSSAGMTTVENGHKRRRRSSIMTSPVDRLHALPSSHHSDHPPHSANGLITPGNVTVVNGTSGAGEDTIVDIDEPWTHAYNDITHDIVPQTETWDKLRRHAGSWRGVTAISPVTDSQVPDTPSQIDYFQQHPYIATGQQYPPANTPVAVHPLHPILNPNQPTPSNLPPHLLRPPTYALHATSPIPCSSLITPFPSTITSSATYLADPLNAYAHLGMPKPYVHLIGPPLDVALDARVAGGKGRWARSGCRPNAVLRPVVCDVPDAEKSKRKGKEDRDRVDGKERAKGRKGKNDATNSETDLQTLAFGIFALRDLKADEEVVLGWEWDDGNVIHQLPALLKEEGTFPPADLHQFRIQMSNILHTLTSTYTTCACGARSSDCAIKRMAEFVERGERLEQEAMQREKELLERELKDADRRRREKDEMARQQSPWTPGIPQTSFSAMPTPRLPWDAFLGPARPSSAPQASTPTAAGHGTFTLPHERRQNVAVPQNDQETKEHRPIDLGPLVGTSRGFKTRERVPGSGGLSGVEMDTSSQQHESVAGPSSLRVNTELNGTRPRSVPAVPSGMPTHQFLLSPPTPNPNHGHVILHGHERAQSSHLAEVPLPRLGYGIKKRGNIWGDGKGKGKAVEFEEPEMEVDVEGEDVDMDALDGDHKGSTSHPRSRKPLSRNKAKEKDNFQSLSPISLSTSLHPPDPGTPRHEFESPSSPIPEEKMPPKMRKRWIHKEAEALLGASKNVLKPASTSNHEKGASEAKKKGKDSAVVESSSEAMDVDEEPGARDGGGDQHSETDSRPRASPSDPFARLSLGSPAIPPSSSSSKSHPIPSVTLPHAEPSQRDSHPQNLSSVSSKSPAAPPIRTSSSFLARVLNSPEHSWTPFSWEQSKPETSNNESARSPKVDKALNSEIRQSDNEDHAMNDACVSKEIKKEALEGMENQSHSTDGEDVVMDESEQDELLPTPSPPHSPSRMIDDEPKEREDVEVDSEDRRSDSVSSQTSTLRQSVPPVIEVEPQSTVAAAEIQEQSGPDTEVNASPALTTKSLHPLPLPSPAQQSMPLSSPLSSPISSPIEPTITIDVQPPDNGIPTEQRGSASSDVVPELVPSTSISPDQSVRDVPPATPPSILSSLSPFSSPVSVNGRDDDVKSIRGSPIQGDSDTALESKTEPPREPSPLPEPEVMKDPSETAGDVAMPSQEAPSTPLITSSNANTETTVEVAPCTETPTQPAPSKVKLSLKDFALRKKRMREEEEKERAEKAKAEAAAPVEETPPPAVQVEPEVAVVNGEVDKIEPGKQDVLMESEQDVEQSKLLTSTEPPKGPVEDVTVKVEEGSLKSDPVTAPVPTTVNGDAKGRPHSPSLAPLPMNILSSLPALTLTPVVSNPVMGSPAPDILNASLSRKAAQQEEGEIDDVPTPPMTSLPRANPLPLKPSTLIVSKHTSLPSNPVLQHLPQNPAKPSLPSFRSALKHGPDSTDTRSRTPPTQPRSFTGYGSQYTARSPHAHTSPIPTTPRVLASVATAPTITPNPSSTANPIGATPLSAIGRPPPSGPRALRQQQQNAGAGRPPIHSIPRGPSHERDRDTRDWPHRYRR